MAIAFKTFKQLVKTLSEVKNEDDMNLFYAQIEVSFQHEKITWNEHEMLYAVAEKIKF